MIKQKRKSGQKVWIISLIIISSIFYYCYFIEPNNIQVKRYTYNNLQIPEEFTGIKVGFISDIHYEMNAARLTNVVNKLIEEKPDILLIGGDFIDHSSKDIDRCLTEIQRLQPRLGIYAVLGNHDNQSAVRKKVISAIRATQIKLVNNDSEWIYNSGSRIKIAGIGDMVTDFQDIDKVTSDVSAKDFMILLSHDPSYIKEANSTKISLILSGHNHGGQMGVFGWYPIIPSKYGNELRSGRIDDGNKTVIVSNGIGVTGLPFRFSAKPDIEIITLKGTN